MPVGCERVCTLPLIWNRSKNECGSMALSRPPRSLFTRPIRWRRAVYILEQEPSPLEVTYFEAATAMAWLHFVDCNVQIVVLEVGLGGRLDATNLCRPVVTAITNISRDHTAILGDSPAEIAVEKAGIIKPGIPLVTGATGTAVLNVIRAACELNQAPFIETAGRFPFCRSGLEEKQGTHWVVSDSQLCRDTELPLENDSNNLPAANSRAGRWSVARRAQEQWEWFEVPLTGQHQTANAAVALELLKILHDQGWPVDTETIRRGWSTLRWPARIEQVHERPLILIDAAHNWAAVTALINTVREFTARRRILLFAGSREKDLGGMLRQFAPLFDTVVLTEFQSNPRATPLSHLQTIWQSCSDRPAHLKKNSQQALDFCLKIAQPDDLLCVTGSFFLAGELRSRILEWGTQAATRV